ncbi:hypothetical protein PCC79_00570 [Propioniciclava soli]|uniref:DUF624 domain-containing protein n=1 Tax=Propioniciclava soli TaxID=2775081 RepID=A0ABZ3C7Z1_9ACTN
MSGSGFEAHDRPFYRATDGIAMFLAVSGWFLLLTLPFWLGLLLLAPVVGNAAVFALTALPIGPALVAALYAIRRRGGPTEDRTPTQLYFAGLRQGWRQALVFWTPFLAVVTAAMVTTLTGVADTGAGAAWQFAFALVLLVAVPWLWLTLTVVANFTFRSRDVARLCMFYTLTKPMVSLGLIALTVGLGLLVAQTFDWILAPLGSVVAWAVVTLARPVTDHVEDHFVGGDTAV